MTLTAAGTGLPAVPTDAVSPGGEPVTAQQAPDVVRLEDRLKDLLEEIEIKWAAWRDEIGRFRASFATTDIELGKRRASLDERDESRRHAIADLSRRLDRLERVVASAEETGSIFSPLRHRARPAHSGAGRLVGAGPTV